ncbi:DUF4321 domain-containing protein [Lachnospira multipara]|jgi:hypothetical protein|uniref:DUF4321 domain-containing protein n=1 Tax=Lachnospira multipara TaxID=28051 RepID=UPI000488FFDF|nr:DUF4321 domain-containing protein [Lachnospira multipara]
MAKYKNGWLLLLFIIIGIVLGGLIGEAARGVSGISWLSYGQTIGTVDGDITTFDLGVIVLTIAFQIKLTVASIIGIILSIVVFKVI